MRTIKEERMARDLDTNSDPGHIARAKAKRDRVMAQEAKQVNQPGNALLGAVAAFSVWTLALVALA